MRRVNIVLSCSLLLLAVLACNAVTGLRVAQTEIPAVLTEVPTVVGPAETAVADFTPPAIPSEAPGSAKSGGLGISLDDVRTVMDATQQFVLKDGSVDGKPAVIASLSPNAAKSLPGLKDTFSAAFIGDPKNLSQIRVNVPFSDNKTAVDEGLGLVTVLFASVLPPDVLLTFIPWITDNYATIQDGSSKDLTVKNFQFTLARTKSEIQLEINPVK